MRRMKCGLVVSIMVMLPLFMVGFLAAAEYPQRPVQLLVGYTAGGPVDLSARALAEAAKPFFPKPFSVVNKPGGSGVVATAEIAKSSPDGYTLGEVSISHLFFAPHLEPGIPYKGPDDFQFIVSACTAYEAIGVRADSPWKTIKDFIDYAKANPGKLRVGNAGLGTTTHLDAISMRMAAGVPITDVPFAGAAPAITALLGGHIEGVSLNMMPILPHAQAGKLRFLAVFANERTTDVPELKDVPTFKELGYDVITNGSPYFIVGPKKMPKNVVDMLYDSLLKAEKTDLYRKFCRENLLTLDFKGPDQLTKEAAKYFAFYGDFIKEKGIRSMLQK